LITETPALEELQLLTMFSWHLQCS